MTKPKLFRLKITLDEVIAEEEILLLPLFSNKQMCSGIDGIKNLINTLKNQLEKFINDIIIPNNLNRG